MMRSVAQIPLTAQQNQGVRLIRRLLHLVAG
jgi:hypothetical protein